MKRVNFSNQVANILEHNKDGSFSTQSARYRILMQSSKELLRDTITAPLN